MTTITFYPSGNADTCLLSLENGKRVIYDYANMYVANDDNDLRIDLESEIRVSLLGENEIEVLAISHLDKDHYKGVSELFWLDHALKYQSEDRIKVNTLWVPAAAILETGISDEGRAIRQEARHRLKNNYGIRVFSTPNLLDKWLIDNGIDPETRRHLMTDAGNVAPEFSLLIDDVEFFVHSPFQQKSEDGSMIVRNDANLHMQAKFVVGGVETYLMLSADTGYELLEQIYDVSRYNGNEERLLSDINNVPHHCSYRSLSDEKGKTITSPTTKVQSLYEGYCREGCSLVSTSNLIEDVEGLQPPHFQAKNYYQSVANMKGGEFLVTMNYPSSTRPSPMVFDLSVRGHKLRKPFVAASTTVASTVAPRAG